MTTPQLRPQPTADRLDWQAEIEADHAPFEAAQRIAPHLGAHPQDDGTVEVGFWTPAIVDAGIPESDVYLEVFTPTDEVDLTAEETIAEFERHRVPLRRCGEYHWGVIEGMQA
ncbi:MAG: glucosylglycerol hydrolase, partial [Halohasta sp.]